MPASIAVVIPCYRVRDHIVEVVRSIPPCISRIFVVDDLCPLQSGRYLQEHCSDPRVQIIFHSTNQGVGGATISGYQAALEAGCDVVVKMDGDGQMDPAFLHRLIYPILRGKADFTKGNRFFDLRALRTMPIVRRIGNLGLTLLTKVASGFWHISDPTNGYTAIHRNALKLLSLERVSRRYFFETSMLINLNIIRAVAVDVPIPARYGDEPSSLNIGRVLLGFPPRLLHGLIQRVIWRYFIYDINAVTILLSAGFTLTFGGSAFGIYRWTRGVMEHQLQTPGTVAFAFLPIILGCQMLLQAVLLDVVDKPLAPLSDLLRDDPPHSENPESSQPCA